MRSYELTWSGLTVTETCIILATHQISGDEMTKDEHLKRSGSAVRNNLKTAQMPGSRDSIDLLPDHG